MGDDKYTSKIWKPKGGGHFTRQDGLYMRHLKTQLPKFKGGNVLEIGPGEGMFAYKLINEYKINKITFLDLEKNINKAYDFLRGKDVKIPIDRVFARNYKKLFEKRFNLIVANVVITETPKEYREDLLNNMISHCDYCMIIGSLSNKQLNSDNYKEWLFDLFLKNFTKIRCEKTKYLNTYALTGEK